MKNSSTVYDLCQEKTRAAPIDATLCKVTVQIDRILRDRSEKVTAID
jgi:hypothetical protein